MAWCFIVFAFGQSGAKADAENWPDIVPGKLSMHA
jgi:hypothetical protein